MQTNSEYFQLPLKLHLPHRTILQGLDIWLSLELISELNWFNPYKGELDCEIELTIHKNDSLLAGLTAWLELGLIEEQQLRQICAQQLSSKLPEIRTDPKIVSESLPITIEPPPPAFNPEPIELNPRSEPAKSMLQSLFSEFSTVWLLFLGVFLTVVSSALLAGSQWQNFSTLGQYLILFAYTLGFLGVSFQTANIDRLQLTTNTLQLVTLLLVPANFWAIDGLGLLNEPIGRILGAIAGLILSGVTIFLIRTVCKKYNQTRFDWVTVIAILLLGWTHLGWGTQANGYPLIAVYVGIGGFAIATLFNRTQILSRPDSHSLVKIAGIYGTILLVVRALLYGNVEISAIGLAIGVCGWVAYQIDHPGEHPSDRPGDRPLLFNIFRIRVGQILLGLGWYTAVWHPFPWQAIAVSSIVASIICDRLDRLKQPNDLTKLLLWGLQIIWLSIRLVPESWWGGEQGLARLTALFQTDNLSAIAGVIAFPYLLLALLMAAVYSQVRHQKQDFNQNYALARRSETFALGFGVLLTILSFSAPVTRFANLGLSAMTLGILLHRRSPNSRDNQFLVYATHIFGLGAITAGQIAINSLTLENWVGFSISLIVIEWFGTWWLDLSAERISHSIGQTSEAQPKRLTKLHFWRNSAWQIGFWLAVFSYLWEFLIVSSRLIFPSNNFGNFDGLIWAFAPIMLGLLGTRKSFKSRDFATKFSIVGLVLWQLLIWQIEGLRMVGLGVALIMMLVNTRQLGNRISALITNGFGLLLIGLTLWELRKESGILSLITFGINGIAFSVILLFGLSHWLKYRRDRQVANLNLGLNLAYSQAFDFWAISLSIVTLSFQTCIAFIVFSNLNSVSVDSFSINFVSELFVNLSFSIGLITSGLVYRAWQKPAVWTEWGIAWGIELLVCGAVIVTNRSLIELAVTNLALGLLTQLLGDWWIRRTGNKAYPLSWTLVPLIYGAISSLLRLGSFSNLTGLITLGTALVGFGIARRSEGDNLKWLTHLSMGGVTFAAYELLLYQMLATKGGSIGDGAVILGVLAIAIAFSYKIFAKWIMPYLRLSSGEIDISANLHWLAGAILLIMGSVQSPTSSGGLIGVGLAISLTIYALGQGRNQIQTNTVAEVWIYLGITTAIAAIFYQFAYASPNPWLNQNILIPYSAAIAAGLATLLFKIPWTRWGWIARPWHYAALGLPLLFVGVSAEAIASPCLAIVAIFYSIRANRHKEIRLTYLSVGLLNWICFRFIAQNPYFQVFTSALVICFSVIYFTQVEPNLRGRQNRDPRHLLRSLASGSLCLVSFAYSFNNLPMAAIAWGLSFGFVIVGLAMRVRAYLFVGTFTFMVLVVNQAILLVAQYGFVLWAIGIVAGICFITVAANFEVRRERILTIARNISNELDSWE
jgi:hypothetical protein